LTGLGARVWAEQATRELAGISGRARTAVELTASEQRVAELVAAGMSNKQVAAALVVTPRTVETHLTRVYAKLGVRSRVELATRFPVAVVPPRRPHSVGVSTMPADRALP
jgi:DNA-binding NarL/FixJ family response regulator